MLRCFAKMHRNEEFVIYFSNLLGYEVGVLDSRFANNASIKFSIFNGFYDLLAGVAER